MSVDIQSNISVDNRIELLTFKIVWYTSWLEQSIIKAHWLDDF